MTQKNISILNIQLLCYPPNTIIQLPRLSIWQTLLMDTYPLNLLIKNF